MPGSKEWEEIQGERAQTLSDAKALGLNEDEFRKYRTDKTKSELYLKQVEQGRAKDLEAGRARGQELFKQGSLSDIEGRRAGEVADIIARRKAQAEGYTPEESGALRAQAVGQIQRNNQGQMRSLRGIQAQSGVRGGLAAAQQARVASQQGEQLAGAERDLFLKNIEARRAGTGALEQSIQQARAEELGTLGREKFGQLSTEMGYASLGAAERGAVMQRIVGEKQAAAGGGGGGGKK